VACPHCLLSSEAGCSCAWVSGVSTLHGREAKIEHGKNGALKETDKREKAAAKSLSFHRQR